MLSKLLAIQVADRYQTCEELLHDWENLTQRHTPITAKKPKVSPMEPVSEEKTPLWINLLVGLGLIALMLLVLYFTQVFW